MQRVAGGEDCAEMADSRIRDFMRPPPIPIVDESDSAGLVKMLLLHEQAVFVSVSGRFGGIVTWADVLAIRETEAGSARRHGDGGYWGGGCPGYCGGCRE